MFLELSKPLIVLLAAVFVLGWVLSSISSRLGARYRVRKRDPRDDRIRSLEAELRIAQSENAKTHVKSSDLEDKLKETSIGIERRDNVITEQQRKLDDIKQDLKESVIKTRELRAELADRASENVHAEAKIREVQTELSVAQASRDMLATGVLDYEDSAGDDESDDSAEAGGVATRLS